MKIAFVMPNIGRPEHGTYVGPGHWFELDDRHFRLGYGWPTLPELRAGLEALSLAAAAAA